MSPPDPAEEFVFLLARHERLLGAYVMTMVPQPHDADDILQEAKVVMWRHFAKFTPGTNFGAWAFTIARLEVKTHRRRLRRLGLPLLDEDLAERLAEQLKERLVERPGEADERLRALDNCLGRLGGKERELIEHRYFSGSTLDDYAIRCGRPVESLRVTLFRIRAALKNCIKGELAVHRALS